MYLIRSILIVAAGLTAGLSASALARFPEVVIKLFTSQGCSSCPPADSYLAKLAKRDDLLALSFHVDYWNYIGWRDPFSNPAATKRQQSYRRALGLSYVYTPEVVIDGTFDIFGSKLRKIDKLIAAARQRK